LTKGMMEIPVERENKKPFNLQDGESFASLIFTMFRFPDRRFPSSFSGQPILIGENCWISKNMPFNLDDEWRKWLGRINSSRMETDPGRIVLTAKSNAPCETPELLLKRISLVFWGFSIVIGIPEFDSGSTVFGRFQNDLTVQTEIKIGFGIPPLYPTYSDPLNAHQKIRDIHQNEFEQSVQFATRIESIHKNIEQEKKNRNILDNRSITDFFFRIVSGFLALRTGMSSELPPERLHQYVRAIESFLPATVRGRDDFSGNLINLLVPHPENKTTLQQIYDLRSAQEHHRPFDQRALPGETDPDSVAWRRTRQAEALAREMFRRFLAERDCSNYFRDESTLNLFWSNSDAIKAWGSLFDFQRIP